MSKHNSHDSGPNPHEYHPKNFSCNICQFIARKKGKESVEATNARLEAKLSDLRTRLEKAEKERLDQLGLSLEWEERAKEAEAKLAESEERVRVAREALREVQIEEQNTDCLTSHSRDMVDNALACLDSPPKTKVQKRWVATSKNEGYWEPIPSRAEQPKRPEPPHNRIEIDGSM